MTSDSNLCVDSLDVLLNQLHQSLEVQNPHLLWLFDSFANEARYARRLLASDLCKLQPGARILEVGGGVLLLSSALQLEGFEVTTVEPIGAGFSAFHELQAIVLSYADLNGHVPTVLRQRIEDIEVDSQFDFAFSINVMEHVDNVDLTIKKVLEALKSNAFYRFICPNYLFPYEPHFNIFSLPWKGLTGLLMKSWICQSTRVNDPTGMWESLNWITAPKVRRAVDANPNARLTFNREISSDMFERVINDDEFSARRSLWIRKFSTLLVSVGVHRLLCKLPVNIMPLMDCSVQRIAR